MIRNIPLTLTLSPKNEGEGKYRGCRHYSQRLRMFCLNPVGIPLLSPALRRRSYAGNINQEDFINSERVSSMAQIKTATEGEFDTTLSELSGHAMFSQGSSFLATLG